MLNRLGLVLLAAVPLLAQSASLHVFARGGMYGFMDDGGTVRVEPKFDRLEEFRDGLAAAATVKGTEAYGSGRFGNTCLIEVLRWGFLDKTGRSVIPFLYREVGGFSEGKAAALLENKWGYVDRTGKMVIAPRFSVRPGDFHDGRARVWIDEDRLYGYLDEGGQIALPATFKSATDFENGTAVVSTLEGAALINTKGEAIVRKKRLQRVGSHLLAWSDGADSRAPLGIVSDKGKMITAANFDSIGLFYQSSAVAHRNKRPLIINSQGAVVVDLGDRVNSVGDLHDGLASACVGPDSDQRCGYIDTLGRFVISPRFASVERFENGWARAQHVVLGDTLIIDRTGKIVLRPKWEDEPRGLKFTGECRFPAPAPPPRREDYVIEVSVTTTPAGASVHLIPLWDWQTHKDGKLLLQDQDALSAYLVPRGVTPMQELKLKAQVYMGVFDLAGKRKVTKIVVGKDSKQFVVSF